jgi:L-xylulokinase
MASCYSIPGYYLMLEGSPTSASNLEWFVAQYFQTENERAVAEGRSVYDLCNELVAGSKPQESGIVFLPFLYGSNVSLDGKACFFGLDGWQTRGHMLRAVYEGVVFSHKWHVDRLLRFRSMPASIRLTGGAARSEVWTQMFADVFQVPVEVPEGTELGALGAAICAAVACGIYPSYEQACAAMVRFARIHQPDHDLADCYRVKYDRYLRMLEMMQPVWSEMAWKS